jgi:hypothetical protein
MSNTRIEKGNVLQKLFVARKVSSTTCLRYLLLSLLALGGCVTMKPDSWNDQPSDPSAFKETDIPLFLVAEDQLPRALQLLDSTAIVELDTMMFEQLTGRSEAPSSTAYLVRALCYAFNPTGFSIYADMDSIWIRHAVLSHSGSMQRYALVILSGEKPNKIFVSCSAIE